MEQSETFYVYYVTKKQFQIFVSLKNDFLLSALPRLPSLDQTNKSCNAITFISCSLYRRHPREKTPVVVVGMVSYLEQKSACALAILGNI